MGHFVFHNENQWLVGHTVFNKHSYNCSGLVSGIVFCLFSKLLFWDCNDFYPAVINKP